MEDGEGKGGRRKDISPPLKTPVRIFHPAKNQSRADFQRLQELFRLGKLSLLLGAGGAQFFVPGFEGQGAKMGIKGLDFSCWVYFLQSPFFLLFLPQIGNEEGGGEALERGERREICDFEAIFTHLNLKCVKPPGV